MIPRSASWSRMRSEPQKSRRLRAAWRSATRLRFRASLSAAASTPKPSACELLRVVIAQHGKNRVERFHRREHGAASPWRNLAAIHRRVGVAHQIEDRRQRLRGIEIVRKAASNSSFAFAARSAIAGDDPSGNFSRASRDDKIPQALHRTRRPLQTLRREIQLAAVRHGGQQKSNRRRLVPFGKSSRSVEKFPSDFDIFS